MPRRTSSSQNRIYLDYAASTPVDPRVLRLMQPYFTRSFGNPGSLHSYGQEAIAAVDDARETVAELLGADFRQVVFTGSATEANNLALRGALAAASHRIREPKLIVSAVEHESVLQTAQDIFEEGAEVVRLPVDEAGRVDMHTLLNSLDERTVLVSIMYANNETGTVQDISAIGEAIARFRKERKGPYPLFHVDAVQAFQFLPCRPDELQADLMTLSAHKVYGPKGVGILFAKDLSLLSPILGGGGQEFGLRSGTENVPLIVGAAEALRIAEAIRSKEAARIGKLAREAWAGLVGNSKNLQLNGVDIKGDLRIPGILNIHIPGASAEKLLTQFDLMGIAVSAGSACASRSSAPSHVLKAMGLSESRIRGSIRLSFGRFTSPAQVRRVVAAAKKIFE